MTQPTPTTPPQPKKRRFSYWVAECLLEKTPHSQMYNRRGRTKKEVAQQLEALGLYKDDNDLHWYPKGSKPKHDDPEGDSGAHFAPLHEVGIEYGDMFELVDACLGENGVDECYNG